MWAPLKVVVEWIDAQFKHGVFAAEGAVGLVVVLPLLLASFVKNETFTTTFSIIWSVFWFVPWGALYIWRVTVWAQRLEQSKLRNEKRRARRLR